MPFTVSHIFLLLIFLFSFQYCSCYLTSFKKGSSLSVEKHEEDVIVSSNGIFSAGFYQIGENAFSFAIWFTELQNHSHDPANIVWMANREQPVKGKHSKLFLLNTGNILLLDAGQHTWSSNTASNAPLELYLKEDGNLVLRELHGTTILWQSFDFPTNTLLPNQPLTRYTNLVSSRSQGNHSSGFYKLFFDDNNVIRLDYDGPDVSSTYWPPSWLLPWQAGRSNYNSTRIALLDSLGKFISSDNYIFSTYDYGINMQRRLTMDFDGNVRVYSRKNVSDNWHVSWQVISDTCIIHGICGANSTCSYDPKKATKNFSNEIGRGGGGVVYRATLPNQRHAAVKRLNEAKQGEGEFLAEVNIIGRLNHMNLIEMWGYCVEGKHKLLVYEYMENGSLAETLSSKTNILDWSKRYDIALGIARVLAYLHEECLEWILHCDIKPQNILLDSNFQPKLADFGLSKLKNRNNMNNNSEFSMIRGTRGYMAPEWIFNLPITSKVDVYSYGVVLLEMITGKSSRMMNIEGDYGEVAYNGRLITWVREKKMSACWVEEIIDPSMVNNCDLSKMQILARVALDCVVEDRDIRPAMSQVVEMLQSHDEDVE
ncbi:unnamed protein product [Trifolium pratense]|uniref:Uncharacterized protein n=1 Tax=Trifolium pratense TaxID=57577 RepID=A0ACB0LPD7_TRIPR|nr:unnamed protein product [Trifolium pratense]